MSRCLHVMGGCRRGLTVTLLCAGVVGLGLPGALAQAPATPSGASSAGKPAVTASGTKRALKITLPAAGNYLVRLIPSADAKEPAQLPQTFSGPDFTVMFDPAVLGKSPSLAVDDVKSGTTIVTAIPAGDSVSFHPIQFDRVRWVEVTVTYNQKPVQAAAVTIVPEGGKSSTVVLDALRKGVARFEDVPIGRARVTVVYGANLKVTQDVQVAAAAGGGPVPIAVPVSNAVPTVEGAAPPAAAPAAAKPGSPGPGPAAPSAPPAASSPFGWIGQLFGLALAAGLVYVLYRWFQSGGMAATLQKAGVEVSGPQAPSDAGTPWNPTQAPPPVISDPTVCPFCGQKKDASGNCQCTLSPGSVVAAPGVTVASQPRLIGTAGVYSGSIFPLNLVAGVTVGREASNGVPLPDDTTVSRRHASFRATDGAVVVSDEGSSNGVYVNGVRISGSQNVNPGDEIQIGNTRFRYEP